MPSNLTIVADWESLDRGSAEERACFAAIGVTAHNVWLTEGRDAMANRLRHAPLLSAYHLAEWIGWNWWRLRWEPRSRTEDWAFAHRLSAIGGGYVWPNITIFSDGERTALIAKPTGDRPQTPFRYICDVAAVIPAVEFELEIDRFIDQVLQRLQSEQLSNTNLESIWSDVRNERQDQELARKRKLEALLGRDPDEADPRTVGRLIADAAYLSVPAIEELAADHGQSGQILTADDLRAMAQSEGFDGSPRNAVQLIDAAAWRSNGEIAAWRVGAGAARALRSQQHRGPEPISDARLAEMAGVQTDALESRKRGPNISFALDESFDRSKVVLRSKWKTGRRFELARLLGDRITSKIGRLFPATRAYTYRQKMQRSFAAEFLSPFDAVDNMLAGDYSTENQQVVAEHFDVSELTIRTLLVNHGRLEREDLDEAVEAAPA
jgi:hypothetical protein